MMDRQCPSCGGFCKKSGCERENVMTQPEVKALQQMINNLNESLRITSEGNFKLREQLAVLQINNTKFLEVKMENEQLKQQLAECERERDELATVLKKVVGVNDYDNMGAERLKFFADLQKQLASVTKDRNELVSAVNEWLDANDPSEFGCACEPDSFTTPGYTCGPCRESDRQRLLREALAKLGTGKTGEGS